MKQEQEVQKIQEIKTMRGIVKFPFYDEEEKKFSMKLLIGDKQLEWLNNLMDVMGEEITLSETSHDDEEFTSINVKTGFEIPIFDTQGNVLNNEDKWCVYDGADVIAKINFKKYEYTQKKGRNSFTKTGITGYLMGLVIITQGTPYQSETTFDDFKGLLDDEDIQF